MLHICDCIQCIFVSFTIEVKHTRVSHAPSLSASRLRYSAFHFIFLLLIECYILYNCYNCSILIILISLFNYPSMRVASSHQDPRDRKTNTQTEAQLLYFHYNLQIPEPPLQIKCISHNLRCLEESWKFYYTVNDNFQILPNILTLHKTYFRFLFTYENLRTFRYLISCF
uniref:Secreted protein n=1 Tax=Heterorhabditis bacteriophora TaxID=37862 RepID=A0A1I7XWC9_HETBA